MIQGSKIDKYLVYLAEKSTDVFWIRSADYSRQIYISPVYEKVWGRPVEEMYDNPGCWSNYLHPEDWKKMQESLGERDERIEPDKVILGEYRIIRPDGEVRWISDKSFPIYENNTLIGFAGIARDVTDVVLHEMDLEKALKKAEVANEARSEFIANMSHDLRTPMTGVMGMLDEIALLANDVSQSLPHATNQAKGMVDGINEYVGIAQRSNHVLLSMFNDILEAVKLDSGKVEYKESHFSLTSLINRQVTLMSPVAKEKGLNLRVEIDPKTPEFLFGFKSPLYRSVNNLLGNALKFTQEGAVTIGVTAMFEENPRTGDSVSLKIWVKDTGLGIPEDKLDEIFDHFFKLKSSYKDNSYQGSGLGLYSVKRYVEYMSGTISVDSELEKGSCFTIKVSLVVSDHSDTEEEVTTLVQSTQLAKPEKTDDTLRDGNSVSEGKGCVLVVEDNAAAAASVMNKVKRKGYTAVRAASGEEAVSMASNNDYAIIFMDIGLPGISGLKATELIRQLDHETRSKVPIVALTGHEDQVQACTDAGMQGLMLKPAQSDKIEKMIEKQLSNDKNSLDLPVIDWDECVSMCCGEEEAEEIVTMCAQGIKESKSIIEKHYRDNNVSELRAELHKARGGVCYLKLPELEYRLRDFHVSVKENHNKEELDRKYESLVLAENRFLQYCVDKNFLTN